jgi:hypothetical protein
MGTGSARKSFICRTSEIQYLRAALTAAVTVALTTVDVVPGKWDKFVRSANGGGFDSGNLRDVLTDHGRE